MICLLTGRWPHKINHNEPSLTGLGFLLCVNSELEDTLSLRLVFSVGKELSLYR